VFIISMETFRKYKVLQSHPDSQREMLACIQTNKNSKK